MQNDFEKQVQQKMEELNFVPSEPVWTNIEKEIRKKDKRRLLIWLPLFLLLAGGGFYWIYSIKQPVDSTNKHQQISKASFSTNNTTSSKKEKDEDLKENEKERESSISLSINSNNTKIDNSEQKTSLNKNALINDKRYQKSSLMAKKSSLVKQSGVVYTSVNDIEPYNKKSSSQIESKIEDRYVVDHLLNEPQFNLIFDAIEKNIVKTSDNKIVLTPKYKWVLGLEASMGESNQTSRQQTGDKSYTVNSPGAYSSNPMIQSPYTKSLSYSFGVTLNKKLNKSVEFQTGIIYQYLSFNVMVGQYVRRDTVVNMFALNQYYRNTSISVSQSWTLSNYKNQLHFINVPVKFAFQPFRKVNVRLSAGLLLQQLIHSNMLIYDANSGLYYNSNKSLNKFLLSSTAGFDYSFPLLKHRFSVGPYVNYDLTNTVKTRPGNLYNLNMRASIDIKKFNGKQRL